MDIVIKFKNLNYLATYIILNFTIRYNFLKKMKK